MGIHTASLKELHQLVVDARLQRLSDRELIEQFTSQKDSEAFTALVHRHGSMVLNLSRRIIGDTQLSEDAFQATFLVLARKAGSISLPDSLAAWLYGTARRIALRTRTSLIRKQTKSLGDPIRAEVDALSEISGRELVQIIEAEIAALPTAYRIPLILSVLENRSISQTADLLNSTPASIRNRVFRARQLLNKRLNRRGLTLPTGLALILSMPRVSVSSSLVVSTLQFVLNQSSIPFPIHSLMGKKSLLAGKVGGMVLTSLLASMLIFGMGFLQRESLTRDSDSPKENNQVEEAKPKKDIYGDALPEGAIARLGTLQNRAGDSHVAVTKDGRTIVTAGNENTVRLWDVLTGKLRQTRQLSQGTYSKTYLSPFGTRLATLSYPVPGKTTVDLWDLVSDKKIASIGTEKLRFVEGVAFSLDDSQIALIESSGRGQGDERIRIWNPQTNNLRTLFDNTINDRRRFFDPITVFSSDGTKLLTLQNDRQLRCWDLQKDKVIWEMTHSDPFIFFTPDSKQVLLGKTFYDAQTGEKKPIQLPDRVKLEGDRVVQLFTPMGFSPDGKILVFDDGKEGFLLWDIQASKLFHHFPSNKPERQGLFIPGGRLTNFAFTPDSKHFIWRGDSLQRFDLDSGKPAYSESWKWGHTKGITNLLFSPDGKTLASASSDQTVRIWDLSTTRSMNVFRSGLGCFLAYTPDSKSLFVYSDGPGVYDLSTGKESRRLEVKPNKDVPYDLGLGASSMDREVRIAPDGKKAIALSFKNGRAGDECMVSIWDLESGKQLRRDRVPWPESSRILPDGRSVLALDSRTQFIRRLDLETGKEQIHFQTDRVGNREYHVDDPEYALSQNGHWMASRFSFRDFRKSQSPEWDDLRIFEMNTGRQIAKLAPKGPAHFVFSKDDRFLVYADTEGIHVYEIATWKPIGLIPAHNRNVIPADSCFATCIGFAPDGRSMVTGHLDSTILVWDVRSASRREGKLPAKLDTETLWKDLGHPDATKAYQALWDLVEDPDHAVPMIRKEVKPARSLTQEEKKWISLLDNDDFKTRETANKNLQKIVDRAESDLRDILKTETSDEKKRRIESLLESLKTPPTEEVLRNIRAVQILERIGTSEAKQLLRELAEGIETARLTRNAKASLTRLGR